MLVHRPPMGWNSWNTFGSEVDDSVVRETTEAIVELGLDKAGYEYVVIDDCWSERQRDPDTGRLVPQHQKFPHGMKALADYVHSKGLKFGIYSCAGVRTCANFPGSFDHEFLDARTFAEWGVDFLKYDFCFRPPTADGPLLYRRMGNALRASGRDILFSACNWGADDTWSWIRSTGAHMYRSTGDICDTFNSFRDIALSQIGAAHFDWRGEIDKLHKHVCACGGNAAHAPGCFNDIDMLTVGMFGKGNVGAGGCDITDYKSQFSLWCIFGAPLMLGADIRNFRKPDENYQTALALVTNKELLSINSDPEFRPAFIANRQQWGGVNLLTLAKMLSGGDLAIGFFNLGEEDCTGHLLFESLGFPDAANIDLEFHDVFTGESLGRKRTFLSLTVAKHDCRVFRVRPVCR